MYISTLPDVPGRKFEVDGVVRTIVYGSEEGDEINAMDRAINKLEEQAAYWNSDGIIGITFTSASTYSTTDDYCTYPDIIAYGSAITFTDK